MRCSDVRWQSLRSRYVNMLHVLLFQSVSRPPDDWRYVVSRVLPCIALHALQHSLMFMCKLLRGRWKPTLSSLALAHDSARPLTFTTCFTFTLTLPRSSQQ